jgi:RES domain-containing protein
LRFQSACYRGHDPRWAFSPLSGEGASRKGGRFNPVGTPALYLALSVGGMFAEQSHGFPYRFPPLTVCTYDVDVEDVVDLRTEARRRSAAVGLTDLSCAWRYDLAQGREPRSWTVAKRLIASNASGILVPSFATAAQPDMHDLVLWKWGPTRPHRVEVYDPSGRLPKDQTSWPAS